VDGIYDLVATTIYQSAPTTDVYHERESIRISGGGTMLEYATCDPAAALAESIAPSGASLNAAVTCGGPGRLFGPDYTATPGHFELVNGLYTSLFALRP
jgi:hypothetical protein